MRLLALTALIAASLAGVWSWQTIHRQPPGVHDDLQCFAGKVLVCLPALRWGRAAAGPRWHPVVALCLIVAAWHLVYALQPQLWDWSDFLISRRDFFFIWGYKAHLFFAEHAIPWGFLRSLPN